MAIVRQYVNLPAPPAGVTNIHGDHREFRIPPTDFPAVGPADRVVWWVEPAAGWTNTDLKYLATLSRARPQHPQTNIDPAICCFKNVIHFPHVGGDQHIVKVSKVGEPHNCKSSDTFETWRKLYYTVYYMGAGNFNLFNSLEPHIQTAYDETYIEWENVRKIPTLTEVNKLNTGANWAFTDGSASAAVDLLPRGTGRLPNHATTKPFHLALIVVPEIYQETVHNHNFLALTSAVGGTTVRYLAYQSAPSGTPGLVGEDCIRRARIRWTGHPTSNVPKNLFSLAARSRASSRVNWDLRTVAGLTNWLATAGHTYRLDLQVIEEDSSMGLSAGNLILVRTIDGTTEVLQTFTHEMGHAVGQTVRTEVVHDATGNPLPAANNEPNPKWYNDTFGGVGPHCSTHAQLNTPPSHYTWIAGLTSDYSYCGLGYLCTMFDRGSKDVTGASLVDLDGKFCPEACIPRVKRQTLNSTRQSNPPAHWNHFG